METITPVLAHRRLRARRRSICRHAKIHVTTTRPTEFIDLTDRLERLVANTAVGSGMVNIQTLHTTTAIIVNEHEPLLLNDFQGFLEAVAPADRRYQHDDVTARTVNVIEAERPNGHAHCRALLLPSSACLNVTDNRLLLGRWQRVFLVELDGPREREISVLLFGDGAR